MITCQKFSIYISRYFDNEVTQQVRQEIEEHITVCPVCNQTHQAFSRLITFCHYCCQKEVPEDIHNKLWNALESIFGSEEFPSKKRRKTTKKHRK